MCYIINNDALVTHKKEKTMTFMEFLKKFPTEKKVIKHFIKIRYPNGIHCNHCGSVKVYKRKKTPKFFDCNDCNNTFSILKDTIFEKTTTDLRKWMYAIHLFLNGKKGISGLQLQREIGVTYKTAWRMLKQIRLAMGNVGNRELFEAIVEIDETYVGGKPRKRNNNNKRGRGTKKTPVIGVIDRDQKKVYARVAMSNKDGKKLTGMQLLSILNEVCKEDATVITDEFSGYNILRKTRYIRLMVDHSKGYSDGIIHTNNIESFWATLKRGVYGIYHHISIQHMQSYVNEFCFRYNNRKADMFNMVLKQAITI